MLYLIWFLSLVTTYFVGYRQGEITKKIKTIEESVKQKINKPPEEEPKSDFIDPTDEVAEAIYEHEQMMKKMNPNE